MTYKFKGFSLLLVVLLLAAAISGCRSENNISETMASAESSEADEDNEIQLDYSLFNENFAKADGGYYYFDESRIYSEDMKLEKCLMYWDEKESKSTPVCANAGCTHTDEESCGARFANYFDETRMQSMPSYLWYYDGYLYTLIRDTDFAGSDEWNVYKINTESGEREKLSTLYRVVSDIDSFEPMAIMHGGNIYYSLYVNDSTCNLYSAELKENAASRLLYSFTGETSYIFGMKYYDNGLVFDRYHGSDSEDESDFRDDIEYCSEDLGEVKVLASDIQNSSFVAAEDNIYYLQGNDIFKYDTSTNVSNVIYNVGAGSSLYYDGKYLFIEEQTYTEENEGHDIFVTDLSGKLIDTIKVSLPK